MKTPLFHTRWTFIAGALLAFPAAYFVTANMINSGLGIDWFWKPIEPIFEIPANKKFGWNINLLILFGPMIALLINALSLVFIRFRYVDDYLKIELYIRRSISNLSVLLVAGGTLGALFLYLFLENFDSPKSIGFITDPLIIKFLPI